MLQSAVSLLSSFSRNKKSSVVIFVVALIFTLSGGMAISHAQQAGVRPNSSGIIALPRSLRCNASGVRAEKTVIEVVVVGHPGRFRCIIRITDDLIRRSDPYSGYVCVSTSKSKPAYVIRNENDKRVVNVRNFKKHLKDAKEIAAATGWPIRIIYVHTSSGRPKVNRKCGQNPTS